MNLLDMQIGNQCQCFLVTYLGVLVPLLRILLGYKIQHDDCFSPCEVLDVMRRIGVPFSSKIGSVLLAHANRPWLQTSDFSSSLSVAHTQ